MKKISLLLAAFTLVALASGCASTALVKAYSGVEQPPAQVARVTVPASVEVRSVNGTPIANITGTLRAQTYAVTTLPGPQRWSVRYSAPLAGGVYADPLSTVTESGWMELAFVAEAGQAYRVKVTTPREDPKLGYTKDKVRFSVSADKQSLLAGSKTVKEEPAPALVVPALPPAEGHATAPQNLEFAAFEQLKSWWNVAGPQERQAFRDWLKTQP